MAKKYGLGLVSIEFADVAGDGDYGTVFTLLGNTVKGSAQLTTADGTTTDFNIEEQDDPVETVQSTKGKTTLAFSCYDVQGPTLVKFFGGTYTPYDAGPPIVDETYTPPDSVPTIEQTVRVTDKKGNVLKICRGSVKAKFNWSFTSDKLAQVDVTIDILAPTKADVKSYTIVYPQ